MNDLLTEGSKRFWDEAELVEQGGADLPDCTTASHLAAASGQLNNVTEETRRAVTGRPNNEHLFYRSYAEIKRRLEIAREGRPVLTVDDLLDRHDNEERKKELQEKLAAAEGEGKLADVTHEARVAVTGRRVPGFIMYRTGEEAQMRIKAARVRSGRAGADVATSPHRSENEHSAGGDDDESSNSPKRETEASGNTPQSGHPSDNTSAQQHASDGAVLNDAPAAAVQLYPGAEV
ncbi:hypothetical protein T492DRAFT_1060635 [Pavlovales sp. CCMP2436]|nr:hypothetical protein T492DRAFT_1060635 [Pavlovales sp. CCMP2436]